MIRALAFFIALAVLQYAASAQNSPARAGDAAQAVVARAKGAFEAVDPDSSEAQGQEEAAAIYAGLPPIADENRPAAQEAPAPRGPAVRMIAREVVQPLPAAAPRAAAPSQAKAASKPAVRPAQGFVVKSILPVEGTIRYGDWFWDESAAPEAGQLVITVDLRARVISAFRDGHEIGTAVVLVGTQEHPTPLGVFPILTKERDNVSEKYNNAPMPWTLRLTRDGIAIHGSPVMNGYASHGCIGVPDKFAAKLFAAAKRGDKVIITRGKMIGLGDKVL
ncbi:MAG: L,D-transpeptidase family protein [Erythrobacter sp.]